MAMSCTNAKSVFGAIKPLSGLPVWHLKIRRWPVENLEFGSNAVCHAPRWRLAGIDYLDLNDKRVAAVARDDPAAFDTKIGSQLAFGGDLGALYEPPGRPPQGNSGEEQQTGESD
jgi:hypothetical protein